MIRAWLMGFGDGWSQWQELTSGWHWDENDSPFYEIWNECYDRGVSFAQWLRSLGTLRRT